MEALRNRSDKFAEISAGAFHGVISAVDGIAIRIIRPMERDGVIDAGNYFC